MKYIEHQHPGDFLDVCRNIFEENEVLYSLMLGISLRLIKNPLHYGSQPLLATIHHKDELKLIALMTPPHKLQIAVLNDSSFESVQALAAKIFEKKWHIPGVMAEEKAAVAFESYWNNIANTNSKHGMRQRIYKLRSVQHIQYPEGSFRQATIDDLELAIKWSSSFHDDCFINPPPTANDSRTRTLIEEGNLYFWVNPVPVSMAGLTRPTKHGIAISYVYTPPHYRRKGFASAIVAHLSQHALDKGKDFCSLYTNLSNPTSNSIYQKIGYRPVADVMDIHFYESK